MPSKLHNKLVGKTKPAAKKQKPVPVKIVSDAPAVYKEDNSWRVRNDLDTLRQAEAIRRDKSRMSAVKSEAKKQLAELSKVCK